MYCYVVSSLSFKVNKEVRKEDAVRFLHEGFNGSME